MQNQFTHKSIELLAGEKQSAISYASYNVYDEIDFRRQR